MRLLPGSGCVVFVRSPQDSNCDNACDGRLARVKWRTQIAFYVLCSSILSSFARNVFITLDAFQRDATYSPLLFTQIKALALSTYHLCLPSSIATCPRPRHSSCLDYYISDSMQAAYLHPSSSAMSSTPFARHPDNRHSQLLTPVSHFPSRMLPPPGTTPRILPGGGKIHVCTQLISCPK